MPSNPPLTQTTHPMDAEGIVRCAHGEQAVKRTSRTSNNFNRDFYTCSRVNNSERCKFFYWADDPIFRQRNVAASVPPPATPPSIPQSPSQRQATAAPMTPQRNKRLSDIQTALTMPSPSQRQGTAAPMTPQRSPSKRLADIEAALNSQGPSVSWHINSYQNVAPANGRTHSFLFGGSTQSSETSTDVDWDDILTAPSPDDSPTSLSYAGPGISDLRTPKKPRLSPMAPSSSIQALRFIPMTPPQTVHRRTSTGSSQHSLPTNFPTTPTRPKGKERENHRLEQCSKDDLPAVPKAGAVVPDCSANGAKAVRHASPNPFLDDDTIAERISSHLDALNVLQASPYIRKLERKCNALNLSNETKAKYIEHITAAKAELENDVAQLKRQNTELQMRLQRCEQSTTRTPPPSTSMRF